MQISASTSELITSVPNASLLFRDLCSIQKLIEMLCIVLADQLDQINH